MGGTAFPMKGSAGPAPQTVWFGALPDRLNMLLPTSKTFYSPQGWGVTSIAPAHYGNLWIPHNGSLGANTTAPDGTTNVAVKLVEDSSNNEHYLLAGMTIDACIASQPLGLLRMATYLKNGNRRIGYKIYASGQASGFGNPAYSIQGVFDLAGGQVGVAASAIGTASRGEYLNPVNTQISVAGGGWYLCIVDFQATLGSQSKSLLCDIFLDNGTGTGAISNSYTGDGASGSFVWRTNMFPVRGYAINQVVFKDDFTSLSTIDTTNSRTPGFNWYLSGWTADGGNPACPVSIAGSIMTLGPSATGDAAILCGVGQTHPGPSPPGAAVGTNAWTAPMLWESRHAEPDFLTATQFNHSDWWAWPVAWSVNNGLASPVPYFRGGEWDLTERGSVGDNIHPSESTYDGTHAQGFPIRTSQLHGAAQVGENPWSSTINYGPGSQNVLVSGVSYESLLAFNNLNNPPASSPADWMPLTGSSVPAEYPATFGPPILFDATVMHTFSALKLPYIGSTDGPWNSPWVGGFTFLFCDGALSNVHVSGASDAVTTCQGPARNTFYSLDNDQWFPIYFPDEFQRMQVDYFLVMQ